MTKLRRISCLCLTGILTASLTAGSILAFGDKGDALSLIAQGLSFEDVTGQVNLTDLAIQNLSSSVIKNDGSVVPVDTTGVKTLIVSLNGKSILDSKPQDKSASEYLATAKGVKALNNINKEQDDFIAKLGATGIKFDVLDKFTTVANAVAISVDTKNISKIQKIASVSSVVYSETYAVPEAIEATENDSHIYETGIYDSSDYTGEYDGSGITVAILDTGLDYTHPAFSHMPEKEGMTREDVENKLALGNLNAQLRSGAGIDDVYYNKKIPFAYDYADNDADVYPAYSQHGVHVAGIVGGKDDSYTDKNGNTAQYANGENIPFRGVAPEAQLVICKTFTDNFASSDFGGATSENLIAALEDCVLLGVDIINMSLGQAAGFSTVEINGDTEGALLNKIYDSIKEEGINLICAASNEYSAGSGGNFGTNLASNPDSGTIGSPATYAGAMAVASINGQRSPYMALTMKDNSQEAIFYSESNDENSVANDFFKDLFGDKATSGRAKYVIVSGVGQNSDYNANVRKQIANKAPGEKVIVVVRRGSTTFKEKVETAQSFQNDGVDGILVYNNVSGVIRMSLGDLENPFPAASITFDAYTLLAAAATNGVGYLDFSTEYLAGPFMNDYSSWGSTPDLKLKPDITAHGGEITSTVSGGYTEMSGTSMASPNLAGFSALLRSYLTERFPDLTSKELTILTNQIEMSTAVTVYDESKLPYSPRKQGAGLATLDNVMNTNAYLYTIEKEGGAEEDRPKIELGADTNKKGEYNLTFYVKNFGSSDLTFDTKSIFFTEELSSNGLSVAEKAHILNGSPVWKINGNSYTSGTGFTVAAGGTAKVEVKLTLSDSERKYLNDSFENGMYVEGFLKLVSQSGGQCDLTIPFMGFYGDWEAAPMLDYSAFDITAFHKDSTYNDETRPQERVWATQPYASYYQNKYFMPMGSFVYAQDPSADQIYCEEEHIALSRFDIYESETSNYLTSTAIKAVYTGLLRNAEVVTYQLSDAETGEIIFSDELYRISKAYTSGGSARPANVEINLAAETAGLAANGKYKLDFQFWRTEAQVDTPDKAKEENTYSMTFYVDYEAPVLQDARIRFYDYKDGNKDKQRIYLDLDVYDNHYTQSVMLCYSDPNNTTSGTNTVNMATNYVTPVYNAVKNGTNSVTIEITDIYEKYGDYLFVQVDDYALNHCVYKINLNNANGIQLPSTFEISDNSKLTADKTFDKALSLGVNEAFKVALDYEGDANLSNFTWTSSLPRVATVKNGEIFAVSEGNAIITVSNGSVSKRINVTVTGSNVTLNYPSISFGTIINSQESLQKAEGTVLVNAGQNFQLEIISDPWYYPVNNLNILWESTNERIATVTQDGWVTTNNERGTAGIKATILDSAGNPTLYTAIVSLRVQDPFTVSNFALTDYHGSAETVIIPNDKNIMTIDERAFRDNTTAKKIIIPKTVTQINEMAFENCTALEEVYFISEEKQPVADADISIIMRYAFWNCPRLKKVDFSNCKSVTLDIEVFAGDRSLEEVVDMKKIGNMGNGAFSGCTSLREADITGLHTAGSQVFRGCTRLSSVKTDYYTAIGSYMFYGCTSLRSIDINTAKVSAYAFYGCSNLATVSFGEKVEERFSDIVFSIGDYAFAGCGNLASVDFNGYPVSDVGDRAFYNCRSLSEITFANADVVLGDQSFSGCSATVTFGTVSAEDGAVYVGNTLVRAPRTITSDFAIKEGTTEIAAYAFSESRLASGVSTIDLSGITSIGEGAFAHLNIASIDLPDLEEIPDYAFYGCEALTSVTVPATVKVIGRSVFEGCHLITEIKFAANSELQSIGSNAFMNCQALTQIELPDGAAYMGDRVFSGCVALRQATLPSLQYLGRNTFESCIALQTVTFGANAATAGTRTFSPAGNSGLYQSSLTSVTLGNNTTYIASETFYYCYMLTSIDLKNVTAIGTRAFAGCERLSNVTNINNVTSFGEEAFAGCGLRNALNLESAQTIGARAFYIVHVDETEYNVGNNGYTSINIPAVQRIGTQAFYGGRATEVQLPATVNYIGAYAFANSAVQSFTVAEGNGVYFAEDGVLFRNIVDSSTGNAGYELVAYPSGKTAAVTARAYKVPDNTLSIAEGAFSELTGTMHINSVALPFSLKSIGTSAFFASGITEYRFESVQAPTLKAEYFDNGLSQFILYSMYYMNFEDAFVSHLTDAEYIRMIGEGYNQYVEFEAPSRLTISYPANGVGYDNYVYSNYFSVKNLTDDVMEDNTRTVKGMIEGFESAETVKSWNSLAVNETNKAMVSDFAERVKQAHALLNNVKGEKQLELLGADNVAKLTAIEAELKSVKSRFGISVKASSLTIASDSAHKTDYVEGDMFDLTGLKLIVTYDDYSSEVADMSLIGLSASYQRELSTLDRVVILSGSGDYAGITVRIAVNVTEREIPPDHHENPTGCNSCNSTVDLLMAGIVFAAFMSVITVVKIIRRKSDEK